MDYSHPAGQSPQRMSVWLLSLGWALVVPLVAVMSVVMIINNRPAFPARADAVFWCAVALAALLRGLSLLLEGNGPALQRPSRGRRWLRYCLVFAGGALGVWLLARLVVVVLVAFT